MLDKLKKKLGLAPVTQEASQEPEHKEEDMSVETQVDMADLSALTAELGELKASFAQVSEALATTQSQLEAAQAALQVVAEEKAAAEAAAKAEKLATRRAAVEANIGTDKADAFMEATKELDDTAFAAICSAMAGSAKAEAESELFKEVGVETKAEANVEPKVAHFNKYIKKEAK